MHSHDVDTAYLSNMYSFWSNLFFGDDKKKSATETPKPEKAPEPAKTPPAKSATSHYKTYFSPMSASGYGAGASMYHGTASNALAKHSMWLMPQTLVTTLLAGLMNFLKKEDPPREDSFTKIDCYGDRVY